MAGKKERVGTAALMIAGGALVATMGCAPRVDTGETAASPELEMRQCRFEAFDNMLEGLPEGEELGVGPEAGDALCGAMEVWENREARSGRRISLSVIVLPATGQDPVDDPLFLFAGGPGEAVSSWDWVVPGLAEIRRRRDLVLVDQRGTGGSHPLACDPEGDDDDLQSYVDPMLWPEYVESCRERLEPIADLAQYTTVHHVDDVDDVRRALGYERINLLGFSYGTRPVLVYARRHPEATRAASIGGVAHTSFKYPLYHAAAGQGALDELFVACAADVDCSSAYPDPRADLVLLMAGFADGPVTVEIDHPNRDQRVSIELYGEVMAERLRSYMYSAETAIRIPGLLRRAVHSGDLEELAELTLDYELGFDEGVDWFSGMWLAVTCTEDVPLITDEEAAAKTVGTVFGDYRVRTHRAACAAWPRGSLPQGYHEQVATVTPFLVTSGKLDPVTPPWSGDQVVEHLPNGLHVVAREGHLPTDGPCAMAVTQAFLDAGSVEGLDVSCLEAVDLPPWDLG